MTPIDIPNDWDDSYIITVEELAELLGTQGLPLAACQALGRGLRWSRFQGIGRLYVTAAEVRRYSAAREGHRGGGPDAA